MGYFGASGLDELIFNDMMFIEFVKRDAAKIPGAARGDPQAELDFGGGDQGVTSCTHYVVIEPGTAKSRAE